MNIDTGLLLQLCTSLLTIGMVYGTMKSQVTNLQKDIVRLEQKQDKHNGLIERMVAVEQSTRSAHHRLDDTNGLGKPLADMSAAVKDLVVYFKKEG